MFLNASNNLSEVSKCIAVIVSASAERTGGSGIVGSGFVANCSPGFGSRTIGRFTGPGCFSSLLLSGAAGFGDSLVSDCLTDSTVAAGAGDGVWTTATSLYSR